MLQSCVKFYRVSKKVETITSTIYIFHRQSSVSTGDSIPLKNIISRVAKGSGLYLLGSSLKSGLLYRIGCKVSVSSRSDSHPTKQIHRQSCLALKLQLRSLLGLLFVPSR